MDTKNRSVRMGALLTGLLLTAAGGASAQQGDGLPAYEGFPYVSHFASLDGGVRMHYLDEGSKGILSHVDPHLTLGQLMARLVREALDRHDPARPPRGRRAAPAKGAEHTSAAKTQAASARFAAPAAKQEAGADSAAPSAAKVSAQAPAQPGDEAADRPATSAAKPAVKPAGDATSAPQTWTSAAKTGVTGRAIPAAVKRAVWRRDRGRCRYVDRTSGRRCGSQHLLQIDHVVPYARGGAAEPNNLRLLCAAHHRYRHAGAGFDRPGEDRQAPVDR